jgi:FKBP-type peptidyl-prolyl cis-trans isomerase FklB
MQKRLRMAALFTASLLVPAMAAPQQAPASGSTASAPKSGQTAAKPPAAKAPAAKAPATGTDKSTAGTTAKAPSSDALTTQKQKASYAIGMNIGRSLHNEAVDVDPNVVFRGLKDGIAGNKSVLSDEETQAVLAAVQNDVRKIQEAKMQALGDANKKEGDAFLAANKTKDGVVTLPSGLQYKVLTQGIGPKPVAADTVVCNYRGTLLNNTEFDSSYKRGQPATFPVAQVIHGWTEALQLMPVGSKWELYIPPSLAYGDRGAGPDIGPNATLVFEVELLGIQGKTAAK